MSNNKTYWGYFWYSFRKAYGGLMVATGLPISFIFWVFKSDYEVAISILIPICFLIIGILLTLSYMSYNLWENRKKNFPNIIHARESTSAWKDYKVLCLLEQSELFSYNHVISVYHIDENGYEILIGIGSVLNIQDDKRILVGISEVADGHKEIIEKLSRNDNSQLKKLKIKPNITIDYLNKNLSGGFQ